MKNPFTRRDFLKASLLSLAAAFLAACEKILKPTAIPQTETAVVLTGTSTPKPPATPTVTSSSTPTVTETQTPLPTALACFKLLTPQDGSKLNAIGKVTFAWEPMPGAEKYRLVITLPNGQEVTFEADSFSRDQYLEAFRMGGKYHWQVTAFDASGTVICTAESFAFEKPEYVPPAPTRKSGGNGSDGQVSSGGDPPTDPPETEPPGTDV